MIDNPEPDQVMQQKQRDFEDELFKEYSDKEAEELCSDHCVWDDFRSNFKEWYHDYLSDPEKQDPNDMIDKKNLIEEWWDEHGDDLVEAKWGGWSGNPGPYEVDPADYEGGEPPLSADERSRMAFEAKQESHPHRFGFRYH